MRAGWIVFVHAFALSAGLFAAETEPDFDSRIARGVKVRWSSVHYDKVVATQNPEIFHAPQERSERLTLTCQVEVRDPNRILGIGGEGIITELIDSRGQTVPAGATATTTPEIYMSLNSRMEPRRQVSPQSQGLIGRIPDGRKQPQKPGLRSSELQPNQIEMHLDAGLLDQVGGGSCSIKGYFHALVAGSIEYIEVPFEPNDTWVPLTPDVAIQVREAVSAGTSYSYLIDVRWQNESVWRSLMVGQPVLGRFVLWEQFLDEDGRPVNRPGGPTPLTPHVGGRGVHSGVTRRVKTIRYVIIVDAKECRIPFELQRVPLPKR